MSWVVIGLLVALVVGFAWDADRWRRQTVEALEGWQVAQDGWLAALELAAKYDEEAQHLLGEIDSQVVRVWGAHRN